MASYKVNPAGIEHARQLIDARQYVVRSRWSDVQPDAETENTYLDKHSWAEYGTWRSPKVPRTTARPATRSGTATSAGCTGWG